MLKESGSTGNNIMNFNNITPYSQCQFFRQNDFNYLAETSSCYGVSLSSLITTNRHRLANGGAGTGAGQINKNSKPCPTLEHEIILHWLAKNSLPSTEQLRKTTHLRKQTVLQALRAFKGKYPGTTLAGSNDIYKCLVTPTFKSNITSSKTLTAKLPTGTQAQSVNAHSNYVSSSFGLKDQLQIDNATHKLFSLTDRKILLLTFDVPSSTLNADIAVCDNSANLVERLMSFIQPLLSSSLWACRWERKSGDHLHLHIFIAVPLTQALPSKNVLQTIWTAQLPSAAFENHSGVVYQATDVQTDVKLFDTFNPDDFEWTYLAKKGPQARSYRYYDYIKISPKSRYHISEDLQEHSKDAVFTIKVPCHSEYDAEQFITDLKANIPTPAKPWKEIQNNYGQSKGSQSRYLAADAGAIKSAIDEFVKANPPDLKRLKLEHVEDFVSVDVHQSGKVFIRRQHIKCAADKAIKSKEARRAAKTSK
jgi:hypothetical protein